MALIFFLLPFFIALISALILGNAGRNFKEKLTIFIVTPGDIDSDNKNLVSILRFVFWISLVLSIWMIIYVCRGRETGLS